jgi:hypothetical protein
MATPKETKIGSPQWARFEDWLSNVAGRHRDWTIVAEMDSYSGVREEPFSERKATLSYLARNTRDSVLKAFETSDWDVHFDIGDVSIEETDKGIVCHENLGDDAGRAFITLRDERGPYPDAWRMWPTFESYFDLRKDGENLVDPYTGEVIVEIPNPAHLGPVRARTDYLQDYLSARNMVLVRQHDHRRHWLEPIQSLPEQEIDGVLHREKWGVYQLALANSPIDSYSRFSRLSAKDIVTPYERAGTVGGIRASAARSEDYPEFITDKGLDGKEVMRKPDPDDLLHPAYFNPEVLKRYYDEPSRYSVNFFSPGMGGLSFLDQWSITFGRNNEGLIVVWLGDLAKAGLSYQDMVHWRAYNVPPQGGMATDFWNAQMMCEPSKIPSLENRLIECRNSIVKAIAAKGKSVYRPYEGPDRYIEKTLRVPLSDEHAEFRETILILSRIFIEYLDNSSFRNELADEDKNDVNGAPLGPIVVLFNWLEKVAGVPKSSAEIVQRALQKLQMVRSKVGVAHRFYDSAYSEVIQKLGLSGSVNAKTLFYSVAEPLADGLEQLCVSLGVEKDLWWRR